MPIAKRLLGRLKRTHLILVIILLVTFLMLLMRSPAPNINQSIANLRAEVAPSLDSMNVSLSKENRFFDSIQYLIDSKQFEGANLVIDRLLRKEPKNDRFLILKGKVWYARGNYDSAMYYYNFTDSIHVNSAAGVEKAKVYTQLKNYTKAIEEYRIAYNHNFDFSLPLADVFVLNNQKDSALKYYEIYLANYTDSVYKELKLQGIKVYPPDSVRSKINSLKIVKHTKSSYCDEIFDSLTATMVYYKYEEEPVYKTGIGGMMRFVTANFYITKNEPWQSLFKITFIVDKDGSVVAPRIEGKPVSDYSASEREMIRVFRKMPRWEPGKCNHTKISCLIKTPIILDPSRE